jgi:hypothetical protein
MSSSMVSTGEDGPIVRPDASSGSDSPGYTNPDTNTPTNEDTSTGNLDSSSPGTDTGSPGTDTSSPPDDSGSPPPEDTSPPPIDNYVPPPPADAAGCSAGSTVFTATDPGNDTTSPSYGSFGTTGPVCVKLLGGITGQYNGWGGNNMAGRTLTLNGVATAATSGQGVVPAGSDGYAIWEWSAGTDSYAGMDFF